jgi:amidophosphoribosyltransferase
MCGIVGIYSHDQIAQQLFDGMTMLQHRGQDAAGIVTCDGYRMAMRKGQGLAVEAIQERHMRRLKGTMGLGHVRYPTAGSDSDAEAQPFYVNAPYGIALGHNGNLTNSEEIQEELIGQNRRHLNTTSDSEIILNVLASEIERQKVPIGKFDKHVYFRALETLYQRCRGGYAVVGVIAGAGLFAFRDPHGIRPLSYGYKHTGNGYEYMVCSESVALDCEGYTHAGDVKPGEGLFIDLEGNLHKKVCINNQTFTPCIFEYVYLSRPDSLINGARVYNTRLNMGQKLAQNVLANRPDHDIDVVIPVPDSGRDVALPIADGLDVDYREGFVKNRYVGRTFIMPGQTSRKKSIRKKLNVIPREFEGKHVLLVDDSIVRGNTSRLIVQMAYSAGAKKVSMASGAPVIRYPNVYGIDMPTKEELVGYNRTWENIAQWIGCDDIFYQYLEDLKAAVREENPELTHFETSIFDGQYITGDVDQSFFDRLAINREEGKKRQTDCVISINEKEQ